MSLCYSSESVVRLRGGFHSEETLSDRNGSTLKLKDRAYFLLSQEKNGSPLIGGGVDFTFIAPLTLSLTALAIKTDIFFIVYYTKIP